MTGSTQDELFTTRDNRNAANLFTLTPPAGSTARFGGRWRVVGAGLSNVWRYGDLDLDVPSGRLLMRGANGTGKTTALEALCPYLLDLDATHLSAGKSRQTTLGSLMREGSGGKKRTGYAWLTLTGPAEEGTCSFGVRWQFGPNSQPQVKVVPFTIPGRPIANLDLYGPRRSALTLDEFKAAVDAAGGQVFAEPEDYVEALGARLWHTDPVQVAELTARLRQVRNPSLLGDVSPAKAADALRASLPGVDANVIRATAEALAESDATRDAYERDRVAAAVLTDFASVWGGHVTDVVGTALETAQSSRAGVDNLQRTVLQLTGELTAAERNTVAADQAHQERVTESERAAAKVNELELSDEFKAAERLTALQVALDGELAHASAACEALRAAADGAHGRGVSLRSRLDDIATDLDEQAAAATAADVKAALAEPLLVWSDRPRGALSAGNMTADPGPALTAPVDVQRLNDVARQWKQDGAGHARWREAAELALSDHRSVISAQGQAQRTANAATDAGEVRDICAQGLRQATATAATLANALVGQTTVWRDSHVDLVAPDGDGHWDSDGVRALTGTEPAHVLAVVEGWAQAVTDQAAQVCADLRVQAGAATDQMEALTADAQTRRVEAAKLRSGQLLPLPRPGWAGPGDDATAFGTALTWAAGMDDPAARSALEVALSESGVLGATLHDGGNLTSTGGPFTHAWQVHPSVTVVHPNLSEVLAPDPDHRLAASVAQVLAQISLRPTAHQDHTDAAPVLVIGYDGSFQVGPLRGDPLADGSNVRRSPAPASHVGARQRAAAAALRADELEAEAVTLEHDAATAKASARVLRNRADDVAAAGRTFPPRHQAYKGENLRALAAGRLADATSDAQVAADLAAADQLTADLARDEWVNRTRAIGLPADVSVLTTLRDTSVAAAVALARAASVVSTKLSSRLQVVLHAVVHDEQEVAKLPGLQSQARRAHSAAEATRARISTLDETAGADITAIRDAHARARAHVIEVTEQLPGLDAARLSTATTEAALGEKLTGVTGQRDLLAPQASKDLNALRVLLLAPGVLEALTAPRRGTPVPAELGPDTSPAPDLGAPASAGEVTLADDEHLFDQVTALLARRRTFGRKAVQDRYDTALAKLSGVWTLAHGDAHADLDTYVLTYNDREYSPSTAATFAQELAENAAKELAAAEEKALRKFVIDRLPTAIAKAWTRIHDWRENVNKKMKDAAASSGVGVQVRIQLARNLPLAVRTVYDLAIAKGLANRDEDQSVALGAAIQSLINAADADTMTERLTQAVNVRDWVDVTYVVTRPGEEPRAWTSRTGLSTGERRLVVLAPMLAAIAAGYDRFPADGLRLATLDEVPVEVDEVGREGLARYIAELDLDLLCTSHLWDGAPGAWDGVDAWDFEADDSDTVVAFPMLVRGLDLLPGDHDPRLVVRSLTPPAATHE